MTLAYAARLDTLNLNPNNNAPTPSNLIPVIDSGVVYFAHNSITATGVANSRIYSRTLTYSGLTLSAAVDVSGAIATYGAFYPSMQRLEDGTLICGYQIGNTTTGRGFVVKESVDNGATWPVSYTFPNHTTHFFYGLAGDGSTVLALSARAQSTGSPNVSIHNRTGVGTWTSAVIFPGDINNSWGLETKAPRQLVVSGTQAAFVAPRRIGSVYPRVGCMYTNDLNSWAETTVHTPALGSGAETHGYPTLRLGRDKKLRVMYTNWTLDGAGTPRTGRMAISSDFGATWTAIENPTCFNGVDSFSAQIDWIFPNNAQPNTMVLDNGDRWFVCIPEFDKSDRLHLFSATADVSAAWSYINSADVVTGTTAFSWSGTSPYSISDTFYDKDYIRAQATYNFLSARSELWLIRATGVGAGLDPTGGGGGGLPRGYGEA